MDDMRKDTGELSLLKRQISELLKQAEESEKIRVRLESDVLVASFDIGGTTEKQVSALISTDQFNALFKPVNKYERREPDGHKFRLKAKKAINNHTMYLQLIRVLRSTDADGIAKCKTVIAWDQLKPATAT
jgi:hypothetical protein